MKQDLESSNRAARDFDSYSIDRSDKHLLRNLEGLLSAARDFHSNASSRASTIYGGADTHAHVDPEGWHNAAESVSVPRVTLEKRRQMESFVRRQGYLSRSNSLSLSNATVETDSALGNPGDAQPMADESYPSQFDTDFDHLVSAGLVKMAQKAIRELDYAKAEGMLEQALARYKMTGPEDAHHSRLRTQRALCGILLGKQSEALQASVIDIAEYRGTRRAVADQLLYALALSYIHTLDFSKAQKIVKLVGSTSNKKANSTYPGKQDILRLFHISYRLSGEELLASAIEEQYPMLSLQESLPTAGTFVGGCPDLLGELFGTLNEPHSPFLVRRFWGSYGSLQDTPLEIRLAQYEKDSDSDSAIADLDFDEGSANRSGAGDASDGGGPSRRRSERLVQLKRLMHRVSLTRVTTPGEPDTSPAKEKGQSSPEATELQTARRSGHTLKKAALTDNDAEEATFQHSRKTSATKKRVFSLLRAWSNPETKNSRREKMQASSNATALIDHPPEMAPLRRRFSWEGMPSTPAFTRPSMAFETAPQPSETVLVELWDTSIYELPDAGSACPRIEPPIEGQACPTPPRRDATCAGTTRPLEALSSSSLPLDYSPLDSLMGYIPPKLLATGLIPPELSPVTPDPPLEVRSPNTVLTRHRQYAATCPKPARPGEDISSRRASGETTGDLTGHESDSGYESSDTLRDKDLVARPVRGGLPTDMSEGDTRYKRKTLLFITAMREAVSRVPRRRSRPKHSENMTIDAADDTSHTYSPANSNRLLLGGWRPSGPSGLLHRSGLVYDYYGPDAVTGPYTQRSDEVVKEPQPDLARAVPVQPENPGEIVAPVELPS